MSKLGLYVRPIVLFDASNKLHRQWVTKFIETGSWAECPVRFVVHDDHGNLLGHIQRQLILWYSKQEGCGKLATKNKPGRRQLVGLTGGNFELTI
jgi:hypothetical protein